MEEATLLYNSEMASWHGSDIFLEKFPERKSNIGGYFSYSLDNRHTCIFFSKNEGHEVIGAISFDDSFNPLLTKIYGSERGFTDQERLLFTIRNMAFKEIYSDTLFKFYKNTSFNIIPIINDGQKKVYVLTGPKTSGTVIFGNDYLLTFDKKNKLKTKKTLHKNIIITDYELKVEEGQKQIGGMHTHLPSTGDFITITDLCTLMLYSKFTWWEQYTVISENYTSFYDCLKNQLTISMDTRDKKN